MAQIQLLRRVVWSPLLVLAVIGTQVAVISAVGVFAATPQSSGVTLSYPSSTGSAIVTFTPDPSAVMGSRSLQLVANCPLFANPLGPPNGNPNCRAFLQIASCADPDCQALGSFTATAAVGAGGPVARVHLPPGATTFLISMVDFPGYGWTSNATSLVVILTWWDTLGFPQGLTALSASFVLATVAGLVAMVAGWVSSRRLGEGWVGEYLRSGFPRQ